MKQIFTPQELKTIEVDVGKKIFRINGEEFGKQCTGFSISCTAEGFKLRVEVETTVAFVNYDEAGKQKDSRNFQTDVPWFSGAARS